MTHWSLNPVLGSYGVVLALVGALAGLAWLRPRYERLTLVRRRWLLALHLVVVVLVLVALLRPARVSTLRKPQATSLLILYDVSRSMTLPSATAGLTRWQAQAETLQRSLAVLDNAGADFEVRVYPYDSQLHAPQTPEQWRPPAQPTGDQTDLGTPLLDAARRDLGKHLAGAILLGDGTQTAVAPRIEVLAAGRELSRLNCPLYTVSFGRAGDAGQARDVAVDQLPEQYSVFVKNELLIRGVVQVRGFVNQPVPVELLIESSEGRSATAPRTIGTVRVSAKENDQRLPVEIPFTPDQPGRYKLTLRAAAQTGELVTRNNELSAYLTVLEGGLRTLYLYGDLLGEQRLLRRALDASPDLQLDDAYLDPRNRSQWPLDLSALLKTPPVDVLLLESVDAAALSEETQRDIAGAVERGAGLMMIGGYQSFGAGGYFGTPLEAVLPVVTARFERQDLGVEQAIARDLHWWEDLELVPARPHPITQLGEESRNAEIWQTLPRLPGANRLRPKPRSQVLLESSDQKPLLVAGEYGQGRVLAFAGNSTYRWRQAGRETEYRRFWRQAILWLAQRDEAERRDVWVQLPQRRFVPGARVRFTAGAKTASGEVIRDAEYAATVIAPDGSRQSVSLSRSGAEVIGVWERTQLVGDYRIEVTATAAGQVLGTGQGTLQVLDQDLELANPAADADLMRRLAEQTSEVGGRAVTPEELPQLLEQIRKSQHETDVDVEIRWQFGDTPWDSWTWLILLAVVLTSEWALRKKWGLV